MCVFVAYFRPHSAGGVQHAAPASEAQCGLWTHRILRLQQPRHQDHQGARGETATGSRHQDYRCVCEQNMTDISRSSLSFCIFNYYGLCLLKSGSFANTLPTYQRSEVMLFIMGKIPIPGMHLTLPSTGSGWALQPLHTFLLWKSHKLL